MPEALLARLRLAAAAVSLLLTVSITMRAATTPPAAPTPNAPSSFALGITIAPYGGTYYAAPITVRIGWCDTVNGTRKVKWRGSTVSGTFPGTLGSDPACSGTFRYSDVSLTMSAGDNELWTEACDGNGICVNESATFTYLTSDATPPTAQITPSTVTTSSGSVSVAVDWCDGNAFGTGRRIKLNGIDVTANFTFTTQTGDPGTLCNAKATSTGSVAPRAGVNTVTAEIQDVAGNWGPVPAASATYTYHPAIDTSPTNQFSTGPGMFDATLSYTTASYRSLDIDRAVTLVYSSSQARPAVMVQVDVTDNSSQPADTMSLGLLWNGSWQVRPDGVQTDIHYRTQSGANRLTTFYGASSTPTRSMEMRGVIKRFWTGGSATDTVPLRILVINESASPYGAGWTIAGVERIVNGTTQDPGIMVLHGDASATYYPQYSSCSGDLCTYGHTPGDFGTMTWNTSTSRWVRTARDGTTSTFNSSGQLIEVRDVLNNVQSYFYSSGRLDSIMDPASKVTRFAYNGSGKLSTITDPAGRVTTFSVNASGDLVSITDPEGVTAMQMTYQSTHRMLTYADRATRTWTFTYDAFGKLSTTVTPSYTAEGGSSFQLTTTLTSMGMAAQGQVNGGTHTSPLPRVNPATLRVSVADPRGRTTRYALDPWGTPSVVEDPLGYTSTSIRNVEGQVMTTTDASGNTTNYGWTGGDLTLVSNATGNTVMVYDSAGRTTDITSPTGETVKNVYNGSGLLSYSVADGDTTRYTYDSIGRVLTVTDPEQHVTTYDYTDTTTVQYKNTRSVTAGGRTTSYRYDSLGRVKGATNAQGRETLFQYDSLNRTRSVTTPDNGITQYAWGRIYLDSVADARGQKYRWTRNAMGWVTSESRPGDTTGVHLTAAYDRYGRTTSTTNRRGQTVSVVYDSLDRVISRTADSQTTTFAYSPATPGTPTAPSWMAVSNAESTDTVTVDERGRLTSSVSRRAVAGGVQRYELQPRYDDYDRSLGLVVLQPSSVRDSIGYTYNTYTGRLTSFRDMAGGTTQFSYNTDGGLTQTTLPPQTLSYGYTSTHLPRSIRYGNLSVDNVVGIEYEYDALNRIQSWIRPNYTKNREFAYDLNGGWLAAYSDYSGSGSSHPTCTSDPNYGTVCDDPAPTMSLVGSDAFTYDLTGNPTNHGAAVGAGNRLATYDGYTVVYDLDGNLTSKTKTGFTQTFTWNSLNQLTSVTTNGTTVSYGYDGLGKRVRRQVGGVDTGYLYDPGDNLLLEYNGSGVQAKYTYYPNSMAPHSVRRGGQTYYYATDVLGSVLGLFNSSNSVVNSYAYYPFGESQSTSETVTNPLRFAGREIDASSGLYYNNARWYDPSIHRFVSEDPIGISGGINLYAYVGNDPVNGSDPSGLMTCTRKNHATMLTTVGGKTTSGSFGYGPWVCDYWGMPAQDYRDLRTQYGEKCTWNWHCPDEEDMVPSECKRTHPFGDCKLFTPSPREWAAIGVRIQRMRSTPGPCAGAKKIMIGYYKGGPKAGHIMFWTGNRLRYNADGSYRMNADGSYATIIGTPIPNGVSYQREVFMRSQALVAHEPLHYYFGSHPELMREYGDDIEGHIDSIDHVCGGG